MTIKVGFPPEFSSYRDKANNYWTPDGLGECDIPDRFLQEFVDAGFIYPAPSTGRPVPPATRPGLFFYDTNLDRPIWRNKLDTGWVFADGTAA